MSEETVNTDQLTVLKVYRIDNGWVTETREGMLSPKVKAHLSPLECFTAMAEWFSKAGVGPRNMKRMQGLRKHFEEVFQND